MLFYYGLHSAEPYFDILFTVTFVVMQLVKLGKYMHFCPKKPGWGTFGRLPEGGVIRSWCPPFCAAPLSAFFFFLSFQQCIRNRKGGERETLGHKNGGKKGEISDSADASRERVFVRRASLVWG